MATPDEELPKRMATTMLALEAFVDDAGDILEKHIRAQASTNEHSLDDLAEMGHPYRLRDGGFGRVDKKGKWRAGIKKAARAVRESDLGHDIKLVHTQSGKLLESGLIRERVDKNGKIVCVVRGNVEAVPYIAYVIDGTRNMIPRDFIGYGALAARDEIFALARNTINGLREHRRHA